MNTRKLLTIAGYYNAVAAYLEKESIQICQDNECSGDDHNCGSYAYFTENGSLATVCLPDYCQRSYPVAISLPWIGNGRDLKRAIIKEFNNNF